MSAIITLAVAHLTLAASAEATTPEQYAAALKACRPSCYHPEPRRKGESSLGCAWKDWNFEALELRSGDWSPVRSTGVFAVAPTQVPDCNFPPDSGGKWSDTVEQVKKAWGGDWPGEGATVVVRGDWSYERGSRRVTVRVFSKRYTLDASACGKVDEQLICEASGSKGARAFNVIRYRLDEAKKLKEAQKLPECRAATYEAVALSRGLAWFRDMRKQHAMWVDGRTYLTRYDADLSEQAVFAKASEYGAEAEQLHAACGGPAKLETREQDERAGFPTEAETQKAAADQAAELKRDASFNQPPGGGAVRWLLAVLFVGGFGIGAFVYRKQLFKDARR